MREYQVRVLQRPHLALFRNTHMSYIVDKTASFVARNGPEFEARIRQNELGNPKFNFLNFGDPYHAYYQHKVKDFREGKGEFVLFLRRAAPVTNCVQGSREGHGPQQGNNEAKTIKH
ncbi:unnamed protein product [Timema podura]|uniref:SURP motif domain-containing protein n=1 Tax=Timema podura TaxID=61482 RepID=A0ABN7P9Q4_TIMPD|nr:unnamed protein product [Timema podura]